MRGVSRDLQTRRTLRHTTHQQDLPERVTIARARHPFEGKSLTDPLDAKATLTPKIAGALGVPVRLGALFRETYNRRFGTDRWRMTGNPSLIP